MALASIALMMAGPVAAGASAPVLPAIARDIASGPAQRVLGELAQQAGLALAYRQGELDGLRLPSVRAREPLARALTRICGRAGLACQIVGSGLLVNRMPRMALVARPTRVVKPPLAPPPEVKGVDLIVSGRRGLSPMTDSGRSFSLTTLRPDDLARRPQQSMAALLDGIPGLWTDMSAGTSANTVRVRGMPLDGYSALSVQEDGLPLQHVTLPWTDIDQFMRPDIMLESADYVRGGPSSILASNAPGGQLNLHIRKAPDHRAGAVQLNLSERGLLRLDGWVSGPVGVWRVIAGGYLARDPTVRRMSETLGGGQLRLRAERTMARGQFSINLRYQNDASLNTSSFPLLAYDGRLAPLPGFDPLRDSWFGKDLERVTFATAQGNSTRNIGRNNVNRLVSGNAALELALGPDTRLSARVGLRHSVTQRNAILSGGPPQTPSAWVMANRAALVSAFPMADQIVVRAVSDQASYTDISGNGFVAVVQPASAAVSLDEAMANVELRHRMQAGGQHDLMASLYAVDSLWRFERVVARALVAAQGGGGLLDTIALDSSGQQVGALSDSGFLSRASTWEKSRGRLRLAALSFTDEWSVSPEWRIDLGLRHEWEVLHGLVSLPVARNLASATNLAGSITMEDSGLTSAYRAGFSAQNASLAANWHPGQAPFSLFARATRGHTLPGQGQYRTSAAPSSAHAVSVDEGEIGMVLNQPRQTLSLTLFANHFSGMDVTASSIDPQTGAIVQIPRQADSTALGLEGEGRWRFGHGLSARLSVTWQKSRLSHDVFSTVSKGAKVLVNNDGHVPQRVPDTMATFAFNADLKPAPIALGVEVTGVGRRYADDENTLRLQPYATVGVNARWAARFATINLQASNLFNALAVMQGDTIAGVGPAGSHYVTGRTLPGRLFQLSVTRQF